MDGGQLLSLAHSWPVQTFSCFRFSLDRHWTKIGPTPYQHCQHFVNYGGPFVVSLCNALAGLTAEHRFALYGTWDMWALHVCVCGALYLEICSFLGGLDSAEGAVVVRVFFVKILFKPDRNKHVKDRRLLSQGNGRRCSTLPYFVGQGRVEEMTGNEESLTGENRTSWHNVLPCYMFPCFEFELFWMFLRSFLLVYYVATHAGEPQHHHRLSLACLHQGWLSFHPRSCLESGENTWS